MGFMDKLKEQAKADIAKNIEKNNANEEKKKEMDEQKKKMDGQGIAYCPKCLSTSVQPLKKGFGVGKAIVGGALLGPIGLLGGAIGKNKIELHCVKCGHKFTT